MLGLKASHASWELKGLPFLPGKSLLGGGELSPEWGKASLSPSPLHFHGPEGSSQGRRLRLGREFCQLLSAAPGGSPEPRALCLEGVRSEQLLDGGRGGGGGGQGIFSDTDLTFSL